MKVVFLSDIHSNWNYLSQITNLIEEEKADLIYFLGDAIGYYDEPNKTLDWLRNNKVICIKGNHEQYFLDELKYDTKLDGIYQVTINKNLITMQNRDYVSNWKDYLEATICSKKFLIVHGDISNSEKHIYDVNEIDKNILKEYDFYVYGHTHIPFIKYSYGCCIINPGSIGQPRDYTSLPSYAVVNLGTNEVTIKKAHIKNDIYTTQLEQNGFDKKVIEILKRDKYGKN